MATVSLLVLMVSLFFELIGELAFGDWHGVRVHGLNEWYELLSGF